MQAHDVALRRVLNQGWMIKMQDRPQLGGEMVQRASQVLLSEDRNGGIEECSYGKSGTAGHRDASSS
jgi:hypothetical protein